MEEVVAGDIQGKLYCPGCVFWLHPHAHPLFLLQKLFMKHPVIARLSADQREKNRAELERLRFTEFEIAGAGPGWEASIGRACRTRKACG